MKATVSSVIALISWALLCRGVKCYPSKPDTDRNSLQTKEAGRLQAWLDSQAGPLVDNWGPASSDLDLLQAGDDVAEGVAKRGGSFSLVTFRCVRTRASAVCKNGGKGPRITKLRNGVFMCSCMCPFGYERANCEGSWWTKERA